MENLNCFLPFISMKDKHRLQDLKKLLDVEDTIAPQAKLSRIEEEWCRFHNLLSSSMNQISEACMLCDLEFRPIELFNCC